MSTPMAMTASNGSLDIGTTPAGAGVDEREGVELKLSPPRRSVTLE